MRGGLFLIKLSSGENGSVGFSVRRTVSRSRRCSWNPHDTAKKMADDIIADPDRALDALAREELGLNPDELGSPTGAAVSSFVAFAMGASIPLLPFLALAHHGALPISIGLTALALFSVGATLSLFIGRGAFTGGLRMLLIGGGAGALTFLIGRMLGVALA
jgi:vacuolar iron transporter family protein